MVASKERPGSVGPENRLPKSRTGIAGLDEITDGGLPRGRATLVCGGPGCGKTVLAMGYLVMSKKGTSLRSLPDDGAAGRNGGRRRSGRG